jgi:ribosomal protein S18 acetylase RimI-like enzyme
MEIHRRSYDHPDAMALTERLQAFYAERYGGPDDDPIEVASFSLPRGVFLVGYLDGEPVATGGWRRSEHLRLGAGSTAEIKRMHVVPDRQRQGLAGQMLTALEDEARAAGVEAIILETGDRQPEAIAFYDTHGYQRIEPFGHYAASPAVRSFGRLL